MAINQTLSRLLTIGGHFLFWGVLFAIFCPEPLGLGAFSLTIFEQDETLWFFLYGFSLNLLLFYSFTVVALPRILSRRWWPWLLLANGLWWMGFTLIESMIDIQYASWALVKPESLNSRGFKDWFSTNLVVSGLILLGANFYVFTSAWFRDRNNSIYLEQEKLRAELTALKHQINPHFLFNVLNSLYGLAFRNDDEPTAEGIAKLSLLMRYMLYESDDAEVLLEKEIEYLENYISLQKLRLDNRTELKFEVKGQISGKSIAPMLLIPFVENAFKFGISTANASFVHIFLELTESNLRFETHNSIHEVNTPAEDGVGGIGLENVKKRLELLYPETYTLHTGPEGKVYRSRLILSR